MVNYMNLGIIGYGNIGELLVQNIVNNDFCNLNKLYISNKHISKINHLKNIDSRISITQDNKEIAKNCEKIIISVKTPQLIGVLEEIKPYITKNTHITHTCAGIQFQFQNNGLSCVIPTIASTYDENNSKKGVSLILHDENVSKEDEKYIEDLFKKFSYIKVLNNELDLEIATIAASCMPAFIAFNIDLLSDKLSQKCNLTKDELFKILTETSTSTTYLLNQEIYNSDELINKVATKNGITQKGLDNLSEDLPNLYKRLICKLLH